MLGISTNQNINRASNGFSSSNLDDDMDPLSHNDWLHEHNLDILFDLFEEELEGKDLDTTDANLSAMYGSSPVTSYLFGAPPLLASTLDLYDLLYFDNQQAPTPPQPQQQQQLHHHVSYHNHQLHRHHLYNNGNNNNNNNPTSYNKKDFGALERNCCKLPSHDSDDPNRSKQSVTNAMKIKKKNKKGQSEGVSLLVKPLNNTSPICNTSSSNCSDRAKDNSNNTANSSTSASKTSSNIKNLSDKATSIRLSSTKKSAVTDSLNNIGRTRDTICPRKDSSSNKYLRHYHHHVHYITGCAILREHAYAVR